MKYLRILLLLSLLAGGALRAQIAWTEPAGNDFNPDDSVSLYINLNNTENFGGILDSALKGVDMYIWTWKPKEHPVGHPLVNGLGERPWQNSNDALRLTHMGGGIFRYRMVPTQFYEVDAATVFAEDFSMLVKPKNGGGYGAPDIKTADIIIRVDPPSFGPRKVYSFPDQLNPDGAMAIGPNDFFSLFYDNTIEEKTTLQNSSLPFYVYVRAYLDDGTELRPVQLRQVVNNDQFMMKPVTGSPGKHRYTIVPNKLLAGSIPAGKKLVRLRLQIIRKDFVNSAQAVDGEYNYYLNCD